MTTIDWPWRWCNRLLYLCDTFPSDL